MFKIGDRVRISKCDKGMDESYIGHLGIIDKINEKAQYPYHIEFSDIFLTEYARYMWWGENNIEHYEYTEEELSDIKAKQGLVKNCLRCDSEMVFLKEYRFDSCDENRGILSTIFDYEENLIFKVYVCPKCRHTEFFYTGVRKGFDEWIDY